MGKAWYFIITILIILIALLGYFVYNFYFKEDVSDNSDNANNVPSNSNNGDDISSDSKIVCDSDTYNCDDFSTCEEVMEVFDECGGLDNDIHKLDNDGDGVPCEGLC